MNQFQRARDEAQKALRRSQMLHEARRRLAHEDFHEVSVAQIATAVGLAKGTVFNYFPTKETLFLGVAQAEFDDWFNHVESQLNSVRSHGTLIAVLIDALRQTPLLPKLISLLHGVLEKNVDLESIREFKFLLLHRIQDLGNQIDVQLGWQAGSGVTGLLNLHTVIIGSYQVANPNKAVSRVLEEEELALFRIDMYKQVTSLLPKLICNLKDP